MFTGLITDIGQIKQRQARAAGVDFSCSTAFAEVQLGESIAVDGVCLTVAAVQPGEFSVHASHETLQRTALGGLQPGEGVHLERALLASDRIGGHFVTGHIDGVGTVQGKREVGECLELSVRVPEHVLGLLAVKGSVAINGTSLTINAIDDNAQCLQVTLIPYTLQATCFGRYEIGRALNIEVDILARYVVRALAVIDGKSAEHAGRD